MTREEAIKFGKRVLSLSLFDETHEFCEIAVNALSQEPCDDVVSRQAVLDGIEELKQSPWATDKRGNGFEYLITEALDMVADLCVKQEPSVRPQEQTGHWKRISMDRYTTHAQYWYECDKCGEHNLGNTNFCPNCGARMVEQRESEG